MKKDLSRELLLAYMQGRCSKSEEQRVRMWLRERLKDPSLDQFFCDLLDSTETEYDPAGKERVRRRLHAFVEASGRVNLPEWTDDVADGTAARWRHRVVRWMEYAAVLVSVALAFYYRHEASVPQQWVEVYADLGRCREVVLPDSTHVWLNAGTKLIYPREFNRKLRQVYLSGEMFADVTFDEDRPFVVSADRMEVKVLGTQFNVKSYQEDSRSEVSLVRGKVSVEIQSARMSGSLMLDPGDMIRLNKSDNHIDFLNFDPDSYVCWADNNKFFFMEQTLEDIVADLRRHFNVEIVITDKSLCTETYYASFINNESLDEILDALNQDSSFSVRREGEVYYITSTKKTKIM